MGRKFSGRRIPMAPFGYWLVGLFQVPGVEESTAMLQERELYAPLSKLTCGNAIESLRLPTADRGGTVAG